MNMGKALRTVSDDNGQRGSWTYGNHRWSVLFLELPEPTPVCNARYDVSHVERLPQICTHNSVKLLRRV